MNRTSVIKALVISVIVLPLVLCGCNTEPETVTVTETEVPTTQTVTATETLTIMPVSYLEAIYQELPPLPVSVDTYAETIWEDETEILWSFYFEPGERYQASLAFDKPVTVWFENVSEAVIDIWGLRYYPPYNYDSTIIDIDGRYDYEPSGTEHYYRMDNTIAFSFSIAPINPGDRVYFDLHITPVEEGSSFTILERGSRW